MQFGLMTEPQMGMTYDTLRELAQWAEGVGLEALARSDHFTFTGVAEPHATDAFATLAGLARDTARLDLVVLVSPITFRHPGVIAKMATTIDEMSDGRLRLGLGTGWLEAEHTQFGFEFYDRPERFARLEEALTYVHHAFGRRSGPYHGKHYHLEDPAVFPRPTGPLPIVVGGQGPKRTPRLAGTYGDEYNLLPMPDGELTSRIQRARTAAEAAGRDPSQLMISMMTTVIAGADRDSFRDILGRLAAADPFGRTAAELEASGREQGIPVGTADEVQAEIAHLEALGVSRVYVQHFGPPDTDLLDGMFDALRS